jgi:dihydrofolate reductase
MGRVIVIEFVTLDGVMQDPDGAEGFSKGGWAFRYGPAAVAGDKFKLGEVLDSGALLLGRVTWQRFAGIWPSRADDFSTRMNRIPKHVVSRSPQALDGWSNSTQLGGELIEEAARLRQQQDVVVAGSASVAHALMRHDLVDQFRLLVFPTVLGEGQRLFENGLASIDLQLESAEQVGAAALLTYGRAP